MNPVEAHYDRYAEREWERLERHRTEFAITCRILAEFLPAPPGRILDVGGGPGRYTIHLTRAGYATTLLDLSKNTIELALEKATQEGIYLLTPVQANAVNLPEDFTGLFDAVLLMGPLYHLIDAGDRLAAIREANRVLRPGGLVFAAFLTRFAPIRDLAIHSPKWMNENPERYRILIDEGINPAHESSSFPDSYFIHPEEIVPFMAKGGFEYEILQGCEGIVAGHEDSINALDGENWDAWVDLNYQLGREPSLHGASDHILYVGRKPGPEGFEVGI